MAIETAEPAEPAESAEPTAPAELAAPSQPTKQPRVRNPVLSAFGATLILISLILVINPPWVGAIVGTDRDNYAFLLTDPATDEPVTWDHCRAIRFQVNPQYAPTGWEAIVEAAFKDISRASEFVFLDQGQTTDRTVASRFEGGQVVADPVLIMWSNGGQTQQLHGDVAGLGGSNAMRVGDRLRHTTGQIVLDADVYNRLARESNRLDQRLILEHEIGHVLGLDHVSDRHQLMFASAGDAAALGRGDVAGLKALHAVPCG